MGNSSKEMINPDLDLNALASNFKNDQRLLIPSFLQQSIALRMHVACKQHVPYSTHFVLDGTYQSKTKTELASLKPEERKNINTEIINSASQGVGFLYEGYLKSRIIKTHGSAIDPELDFLHGVFDYLNGQKVLQTIRDITGNDNIVGAEAQYTRYTAGNFLTRHLDVVSGQHRQYAFVLGLTQNWHPDWGGLLQFYERNGTPRDAWTPQFNVLSLFDVKHVHSVTYVTPFATEPRLSLTGWFVGEKK